MRLLAHAYPCGGFAAGCDALAWAPAAGLVPRGFCGATGVPGDVRLVLVLDHPIEPHRGGFGDNATAFDVISAITHDHFVGLSQRRDPLHANLRFILDRCFPGTDLQAQLRRCWITHSVLCAGAENDELPAGAWRECRGRYFDRQLDLFSCATPVALGHRTARRLAGYPGLLEAADPAPPACKRPGARESWIRLGERFGGA